MALAGGIASQEVRQFDFARFGMAAVDHRFKGALHRLVITAARERRREQPVAEGQRIMHGMAAAAAIPIAAQAAREAGVKEIIERPPVVIGHRHAGLMAASGARTAIVQRGREAERKRLPVLHDQIAVAGLRVRFFRGRDLDVSLRSRHAPEVFQSLLDGAQVEQISFRQRQRRDSIAARVRSLGHAHLAQPAGNHREDQPARGEILRLRQHAGGGVARRA